MKEEWIVFLPVYFVRAGHVSVFTLLYGLLRVLNVGKAGAVTVCGLPVLGWKPAPVETWE